MNNNKNNKQNDSINKETDVQKAAQLLNAALSCLNENTRSQNSSCNSQCSSEAEGSLRSAASNTNNDPMSRSHLIQRDFRAAFPALAGSVVRNPLTNNRKRKAASPKYGSPLVFKPRETWTHDFVCLEGPKAELTPNQSTLMALSEAGLGRKKITFTDKLGGFNHVKTTLEGIFPKLLDIDGVYEFLRAEKGGSNRALIVIPIPKDGYSVPYIRDTCPTSLVYIRPIQKELTLEKANTGAGSYFGSCTFCNRAYPINELKEHTKQCPKSNDSLMKLKDMFPETNEAKLNDVIDRSESLNDALNTLLPDAPNLKSTEQHHNDQSTNENVNTDFEWEGRDREFTEDDPNINQSTKEQSANKESKEKQSKKSNLTAALKDRAEPRLYTPFNIDEKDVVKLVVRRKHIWKDALKKVTLISGKVAKPFTVEFSGEEEKVEEAVDFGGPKNDFFTEVTDNAIQRLMCGVENNLTFTHDAEKLSNNIYEKFGTLTALSLLNGNPGPRVFNHNIARYILDLDFLQWDNHVKSVPDLEIMETLLKIQKEEDADTLKNLISDFDQRFDAGINHIEVKVDKKNELIEQVTRHYLFSKCIEEIQQFMAGLSYDGVLNILRQYPDEALNELCFGGGISLEYFKKLIVPVYTKDVSASAREKEGEVYYNFITALETLDTYAQHVDVHPIEGEVYTQKIELADIFKCITGLRSIPARPDFEIKIKFKHDVVQRFHANTCIKEWTLPTTKHYLDEDAFLGNFLSDIVSSPGFGKA